jgi:hypothetical protein
MSISYSSIVGFGSGKVTLPSVETWGSNMNILRDPQKSIYTRKIDKVGETSNITQMIDDSGDRACEAILVYARGKNPMVAVSYDNYGNNGGQRSGNVNQVGFNVNGGSAKQAYLPYRIMDKGAFRPPIRDQRDLLPLSRLPRTATSSFTKAGFADFSKKAMCPSETGEDIRSVKKSDQMLRACIRPTATYQLETPIVENYQVKYVIKNPVQVSASAGIQPKAKYNGEIGNVRKMVENPLRLDINVNQVSDHTQVPDISNFNTEKYTQEVLQGRVNSNTSQNISVTSIDDILGVNTSSRTKDVLQGHIQSNTSQNIDVTSIDDILGVDTSTRIKDSFNIDYETPHTSYEKNEYIHGDINLQRVLPYHESRTNSGYSIHKAIEHKTEREYTVNRPNTMAMTNYGGGHMQVIDNISSRNYNLKPTVNAGGFDAVPSLPQTYHENTIQEVDLQKSKLRRSIYEMQQDRNLSLGRNPYENFA